MSRRVAAVLSRPHRHTLKAAGVNADRLRLAMLEDTFEVLADLDLVEAALALCPPDQPDAERVTWPGSPVLRIEAENDVAETLAVLTALGAVEGGVATEEAASRDTGRAAAAAVVAPDVPDLPPLLIGKLFRAVASVDVAACPAAGGGLVALATRLPVPGWLTTARTGLDTPDALVRLHRAAPPRRGLSIGPGWHRLRAPDDLARLDEGLEGWALTRALLRAQS